MKIDLNYSLTLSEIKTENFTLISKLPIFYKEIFGNFNECKITKDISNLSDVNFAELPLWNNNLFQYKYKTLCLRNWIASNILYVKDEFNKNGVFKLQEFSDILSNRSNSCCVNTI